MRILHTSDWHLGRSFHRVGMLDAQGAFIDHLVETIRSERVDVVVVSGDIYDRALPPVDAVALASSALRRLLDAKVRVVVTSGNHDSAPRLGFAADLIDGAGVHLRTDPREVGRPVLISGLDGEVAFYGLPYLEPDLVRDQWSLHTRSHQVVLDEAMRRVRLDLGTRPRGTRSVVLAHAFVVGARSSESERDISVGGVASVGLSTFDGVDYVALGHLHGRHTLSARVRYSGSPLAYSFSEARHRKGSWLVEVGAAGLGSVEFVDAPVPRPLALVRGDLETLLTADTPDLRGAENSWVQATLTDIQRPLHAMERLRLRFPQTLVVKFEPAGQPVRQTVGLARHLTDRSDADIIAGFVSEVRGADATRDELTLLQTAADACRLDSDVAS